MSIVEAISKPIQSLDAAALEAVFHQVFYPRFNTRLKGGGSEPIYLPQSNQRDYNLIVYSHDYAASALHEIAHWCVAGATRRKLEDYGYWYAADGRTLEQQKSFESVEVKPQAFEWMFSVAAARKFRVSADNLEAGVGASEAFKQSICEQAQRYCRDGLPERAGLFINALATRSGCDTALAIEHYGRDRLA